MSRRFSREIRISQIAGQAVNSNGAAAIAQLYAAMEASGGKPVPLTVRIRRRPNPHNNGHAAFRRSIFRVRSEFPGNGAASEHHGAARHVAGLEKLKPGDAILAVDAGTDHLQESDMQADSDTLLAAGDKELKVSLTVLDPGQTTPRSVDDLTTYHLRRAAGISVWESRSGRTSSTSSSRRRARYSGGGGKNSGRGDADRHER